MQTNDSSNQVKQDEFRVGDRVWCVLWGEGVVSDIYDSYCRDYTVEVTFNGGDSVLYTSNGQYTTEANRTLFFSEPKIEASVTRPFIPKLVGKRVVVTEPPCYNSIITIKWETEDQFGSDNFTFRKEQAAVYEVSSENLLKS